MARAVGSYGKHIRIGGKAGEEIGDIERASNAIANKPKSDSFRQILDIRWHYQRTILRRDFET